MFMMITKVPRATYTAPQPSTPSILTFQKVLPFLGFGQGDQVYKRHLSSDETQKSLIELPCIETKRFVACPFFSKFG